jgi:uncharacterized protein (TIGR02466 family)
MSSPPQVIPMFAVPVGLARHPNPAPLNARLKAYLLEEEKKGTAGANPRPLTVRNTTVYESHFDLFRVEQAEVQELKRFCWDQLLAVIGQLNNYTRDTLHKLLIYNDCWFHITRRGGFFGLHNHPNASWSGVYCVDAGLHDAGKSDTGNLTFVNPMVASAMYLDAANARIPPPYGPQLRSMRLEAGQLVIFPSYLLHDVKPFEGDGTRITIAFNCWFQLPEP